VDADTVARVASAQAVPPADALHRAVGDALVAASARTTLGDAAVRQARRGALARVLLEAIADQSKLAGPPTDAELNRATERRWWELDRPELRRTTHAVVVVKEPKDAPRARALADRIFARVSKTSDAAAFRAAALSEPNGGLEVRVEDLMPVARDGRAVDLASPPAPGAPVATYVTDYVNAAFAISAPGRTSPVFKSEFGYHVILFVEAVPEHRVPLEERRTMLTPEILESRSVASVEAVLTKAKAEAPVEVERSAIDSMLRVKTVP
jgi:hypothetical protein